ncbi:ISKra4 family transposase [Candidatus Brocadia pituitae]|nr:ISKra4 family transposase [Candidatus Brocadia pituitae]
MDEIEEEYGREDLSAISREEIDKKIEDLSKAIMRRPVMMLALGEAYRAMRPETDPHPRKEKRGEWILCHVVQSIW